MVEVNEVLVNCCSECHAPQIEQRIVGVVKCGTVIKG